MRVSTGIVFALVSSAAVVGVAACSSEKAEPAPVDPLTAISQANISYYEHVEPILQKHCQSCHHGAGEGGDAKGGLGPFSLISYENAKANAAAMALRTKDRSMPPWGAFETAECKPRLHFQNDLRMTDIEIATVARWAELGAPPGDTARAAKPMAFSTEGLANANMNVAPALSYAVAAATDKDEFRCFVIDPKLPDDNTWVNGLRVVPGNPAVTHHVLVFEDTDREAETKVDVGGSYSCFGGVGLKKTKLLAAWAPGAPALDFGDRAAMPVKKSSLLVMQVHYHPRRESTETDLTHLEIRTRATAPEWLAIVQLIGNAGMGGPSNPTVLLPGPNDPATGPAFVIPANVAGHTEDMELTLPKSSFPGNPDVRIASVGTHMHWVGVDMRISIDRADPPEGQPKSECLIEVPRWDFNWQRGYAYDAAYEGLPTLRAGDTLKMRCKYDNTMSNPFVRRALADLHLTEPKQVVLGEQTLDEMCLGAFVFLAKIN